jgi:hypothetical protein
MGQFAENVANDPVAQEEAMGIANRATPDQLAGMLGGQG